MKDLHKPIQCGNKACQYYTEAVEDHCNKYDVVEHCDHLVIKMYPDAVVMQEKLLELYKLIIKHHKVLDCNLSARIYWEYCTHCGEREGHLPTCKVVEAKKYIKRWE